MKADFEEKQYEFAANAELLTKSLHVYPPGQVAEKIVGYDVAADQPVGSAIWSLIKAGRPSGIQLTPNLWQRPQQPLPDVNLPAKLVTLFLQYKRSDRMERSNSKQYNFWQASYFRFKITPHQQKTLRYLESRTSLKAVVRYAAPTFYRYKDLVSRQLAGTILDESNFVSPSTIGRKHSTYSFRDAGIVGYANEEGEKVRAESWQDVIANIHRTQSVESILAHHRELATALAPRLQIDEQVAETKKRLRLEDSRLAQGLHDLLTIGDWAARAGATWWLLAEELH